MKVRVCLEFLLILALVVMNDIRPVVAAEPYIEGWDNGTLNGWLTAYPMSVNALAESSGGNPGGYIWAYNWMGQSASLFTETESFTGDYMAAGIDHISLDARFNGDPYGPYGPIDECYLHIGGSVSGGWIYLLTSNIMTDVWLTFQVEFNSRWSDQQAQEAGWTKNGSEWRSFTDSMKDVRYVGVKVYGPAQMRFDLDNFGISGTVDDPYTEFNLCSNEIGCSLAITGGVPPLEAASLAVSWCQVAQEYSAGHYANAAIGALGTGVDLILAPGVSAAGVVDCLEILWDAYYDDVISAGKDWIQEVENSAGLVFGYQPLFLDIHIDISFLWVASPVSVSLVDHLGNTTTVDNMGNVFLDSDMPTLGAFFGDHQKLLILADGPASDHELRAVGSGATPGDTFTLILAKMTELEHASVVFGGVPTEEGAEAVLDLETQPSEMAIEIDMNGDGVFEETQFPERVEVVVLSVFADGFESGDTSDWSAAVGQ